MSTRKPFEIRQLTSSDASLLDAMSTTFGEAFDDMETYCAARPGRDYLRELLEGESFIALAALSESSVVGGLAAYELRKFERERSEIYIYDLAVAEPHRRNGIAKALIRSLVAIAESRHAHVVFMQADHGDHAAIELYRSLGTLEQVLHFDIPVGGGR